MIRARATSEPRTLSTYSWDSRPSSSWMRTAGITIPSSPAIWRRIARDTPQQVPAGAAVHERDQAEADGELQGVDGEPLQRLLGALPVPELAGPPARSVRRAASAPSAASSSPGSPWRTLQPIAPKIAAIARNGSLGRPGTSANSPITVAATSGALRWRRIWQAMSLAEVFLGGGAGDDDAGGDRDQAARGSARRGRPRRSAARTGGWLR